MVQEFKKKRGGFGKEEEKKEDKKTENETAQLSTKSKKKQKKKRDEESVILMGPAYTEEEDTMQPISDILPESDLFEGELIQELYGEPPPPTIASVNHHPDHKKYQFNTPRFFLGIVFIFVGLVYLLKSLELFNIVNVNILYFWSLIFIFLGLIVVGSWKKQGKIIGVMLALLVVVIVFGVLLNDGRIIGRQLSENIIEERREVTSFTSIAFLGAGNLVIKQGREVSLIIKADASVINNIKAEILNKELHLSAPRSLLGILFNRTAAPTYLVTVTDLKAVRLTGSGHVQSTGFNTDRLELSIRGSGNIEINNIEAREVIVSLSGSGRYTLSGTTTRQIVHILGSGNYKASNLVSKEAGIRITGSGNVLVTVTEELNAAINGSGEIRYIGDPLVSEESVLGSGTIVRISSGTASESGNIEMLEQLRKIDAVKYPKIEKI